MCYLCCCLFWGRFKFFFNSRIPDHSNTNYTHFQLESKEFFSGSCLNSLYIFHKIRNIKILFSSVFCPTEKFIYITTTEPRIWLHRIWFNSVKIRLCLMEKVLFWEKFTSFIPIRFCLKQSCRTYFVFFFSAYLINL